MNGSEIRNNNHRLDGARNPYEEKAHRGPAHKAVQAWWEQCQAWMLYYKCQCEPLVQDLKGFLHALRGMDDCYMVEEML